MLFPGPPRLLTDPGPPPCGTLAVFHASCFYGYVSRNFFMIIIFVPACLIIPDKNKSQSILTQT